MTNDANIALVPVVGDLDVTSVAALRQTIERLIEGGSRRIILNMAGASYVDSAGMGLVMSEIAHMRQLGGLLSLVNVNPAVMRAFRRARVVDFAPVSSAEDPHDVPALDPSVAALWRRVLHVGPSNLSDVRARTNDLLSALPLSDDERFDVSLAIGEAIGNAVDHTSGESVVLAVAAYPDRVVAEVSDCGCGCCGSGPCEEEPQAPWAARGRGIRLMRMLADSVTIENRSGGSGTLVRIVKLVNQI